VFGIAFFAFAFLGGLHFGSRFGCMGIRTVGLMFGFVAENTADTVFRRPHAISAVGKISYNDGLFIL